jgi:Fe-S oxidoreductase
VVTACPNCQRQLSLAGLQDVEVVSIYGLMVEAGVRVPVTGGRSVTVHDSCSDRSGQLSREVRELLADYEIREMRHHGANTICCGCGGIVPAVDPDTCAARAETRLAELKETDADLCVTYCMSCAYKLGVQSREKPVRNVLELLFDQPLDHAGFDEKAYGMWQGEAGEALGALLQNSKLAEF